jgi:periplasmic mercuric ion binding protein
MKFYAFAGLFLAVICMMSCNSNTITANLKTDTFKVWGNCGMCKKTIEKSLKTDGVATSNWDKDSKIMVVSYDSTMISLQQIQQNIAAAGYDNEGAKGEDAAYANLHSCCQYERKPE